MAAAAVAEGRPEARGFFLRAAQHCIYGGLQILGPSALWGLPSLTAVPLHPESARLTSSLPFAPVSRRKMLSPPLPRTRPHDRHAVARLGAMTAIRPGDIGTTKPLGVYDPLNLMTSMPDKYRWQARCCTHTLPLAHTAAAIKL